MWKGEMPNFFLPWVPKTLAPFLSGPSIGLKIFFTLRLSSLNMLNLTHVIIDYKE